MVKLLASSACGTYTCVGAPSFICGPQYASLAALVAAICLTTSGVATTSCLWEGFYQRLKTKIEIRIARGVITIRDSGLPFFLDHLHQLFPHLFDAELRVEKYRFMRTGNEGRVDGKSPFSCGL